MTMINLASYEPALLDQLSLCRHMWPDVKKAALSIHVLAHGDACAELFPQHCMHTGFSMTEYVYIMLPSLFQNRVCSECTVCEGVARVTSHIMVLTMTEACLHNIKDNFLHCDHSYSSNYMKPWWQSPLVIGQQTTAWHTALFDLLIIAHTPASNFVIRKLR